MNFQNSVRLLASELQRYIYITTQDRREKGGGVGGGGRGRQPFPGAKKFFPRKIGKHKFFTCE